MVININRGVISNPYIHNDRRIPVIIVVRIVAPVIGVCEIRLVPSAIISIVINRICRIISESKSASAIYAHAPGIGLIVVPVSFSKDRSIVGKS
jgi:hypothetical protein